jgi:hypothetical protein
LSCCHCPTHGTCCALTNTFATTHIRQQQQQAGVGSLTSGLGHAGTSAAPAPDARTGASPARRVSEHDLKNTANALELLQAATFKLTPGKDEVPYEQLVGLRLEDGVDVTRKVRRARV